MICTTAQTLVQLPLLRSLELGYWYFSGSSRRSFPAEADAWSLVFGAFPARFCPGHTHEEKVQDTLQHVDKQLVTPESLSELTLVATEP
jgi:hypothetical protein